MKILFVAPWIPAPVRPRSLVIMKLLNERHDVRFLGLAKDDAEAVLAAKLPVREAPVLVHNPTAGSLARTAVALGTGASLQTGYANPGRLTAELKRLIAEWRPDAVHLNVFRTAHLVEECGDTPVIIDLDEFRSEYYEQLAETGPNVAWRMIGRVEQRRMGAREAELVRMGVPIILSAPALTGELPPNTFVVRSPYDYTPQPRQPQPRPTVLFVGRLTYEANVNGLMWFIRECWPQIRRAVPAALLRIVGEAPPKDIQALAGDDIEVIGDVPSVDPYYAAADVAIAPIFRGTGIQMKVIQSLAAEVPTVTTRMVAARAGVADGVHVRTADDPAGWVAATSALLANPADARRMAAAGREWAVANHGTDAVRAQLAAAYRSLSTPIPQQRRRLAQWSQTSH
ncbi:glycosyltransferase [Dactylosporangium sp. NPDC051541]|uniref:glycosyltransferase n=1 Tax=Dactylosporangium sp. NPDC051541 TaxID=3363977 RepID=UPI0037B243F9